MWVEVCGVYAVCVQGGARWRGVTRERTCTSTCTCTCACTCTCTCTCTGDARIRPSNQPLTKRRTHPAPRPQHALLLHTDYIVEAGAHAGSQLERLSVAGASEQARTIRPQGLGVALRYARAARSQSVLEVDRLAYSALRSWVASVGLAHLPRVGGWAALTRWACDTAARGDGSHAGGSLYPLKPSIPEAEPEEPAE